MKKLRVAAYCRVSTSSKDQVNSFKNQKEYFTKEISKNPDYAFVGIYADKGLSGTSLSKRPEFNRLLLDCGLDENFKVIGPSKIDKIFVKNTSRFARNVSVDVILKALADNKVYVYFLDLNKSTENNEDITYIQIFLTFDERESRDKSKKVLFGVERSAEKNIIRTNPKIYGYDYIKIPENKLIQNEDSKVIREIFDMYIQGNGVRRIINRLTDEGHLTKSGKPFGKTQIIHILTNEKYAGLNPILKYDNGRVFQKNSYAKVKENYKVLQNNRIEAIITPEEFYKCQELRKNKVNYKNQKGKNIGKTKYRGLLICGICGENYISNVDRGRRFYNCKTKKALGVKACNNLNVSEKEIEEYISKLTKYFNKYKKLYLEDLVISLLRMKRYELAEKINLNTNDDVLELQKEKEKIEKKAMTFLNLLSDDESNTISSAEIVKKFIGENQEKIDSINETIKELTKYDEVIIKKIYGIENIIKYVDTQRGKDVTEADMMEMINSIVVNNVNGEKNFVENTNGLKIYSKQKQIEEYLEFDAEIFYEQIDTLVVNTETEYKESIIDKYLKYKNIALEEKINKEKQKFIKE